MSEYKLSVDQILRYPREFSPNVRVIDNVRNFWHLTHAEGFSRPQLEKGINPTAAIKTAAGSRRPVILISSSPNRVGSAQTPWHDIFDVDNGHIRYFGDAKTPRQDPAQTPGNKALLEAHATHAAIEPSERARATPIMFFRRTAVNGATKGFLTFQGFGIVERAERLTQFDQRQQASFSNYVYDLAVLSLTDEHETFDWDWINARRNPARTDEECLKLAPRSWQRWLQGGASALPRNRRHVSKLLVTKPKDQLPEKGSRYDHILQAICEHYANKKHHFEGLAYAITRHLLSNAGSRFVDGWITPSGGDGGADFIARLDTGQGFGAVRQIVYGQAKCIATTSGVDGKDIARTVARLKRGWFGAFVATSYFSEPVQREVIEDEYPVLLVSGLTVAETTYLLAEENGCTVGAYLDKIDAEFAGMKARRRPEEILHF
jgi:hypothetical protein